MNIKKQIIVMAIGGNALGNTPSEQKKLVQNAAKSIVDVCEDGYKVLVVHGNGPQVGWINDSFELAHKQGASEEALPFAECVAMSQGYIGFHIQNAIKNELFQRGIEKAAVVSLVSEVLVNANDSAFKNPSKPIGPFLTKKEADKLSQETSQTFVEDAGRGYRKVIASPQPLDMPAIKMAKTLCLKGVITILGGGGGIPVVKNKNNYEEGVDAVVDKDATASFVAQQIKAYKLIILTAVDKVKISFGTKREKSLAQLSLKDIDKHINNNEFAKGSMLPKVLAAKSFVEKTKNSAYIGLLSEAHKIVQHKSGTKICV